VRLAAPDGETKAAIDDETLTDAERLRVVHLLITSPEREGGAGVTPGLDGWSYVESIFPLHDSKFNRVSIPIPPGDVDGVGMDSILVSEVVCARLGIGYRSRSFRGETRFLFRIYATLFSLSRTACDSGTLLTFLFTCV